VIRFVTTNRGKFREVRPMFAAAGIPLRQLDREYPEVQADSLEEVLAYAAGVLDREVGGDYLADDSGLFVDALRGFPGVFSAHAYRTLGCKGLLRLLAGTRNRGARFECRFLVCVGGRRALLSGTCRGRIAAEARGARGFGFDPIFVPAGHRRTLAEMTTEEKNAQSHRGRAAREVIRYLRSRRLA